jgi:hypothetical protein
MSDPIDRVLERLDGVTQKGKQWTALCPAHADAAPSLSISIGDDGTVLMHCFGGCNTADVVDAIGLQMRELFASAPGCTLQQYAAAKKLPLEFLREQGLLDATYRRRPAVYLPIPRQERQGHRGALSHRARQERERRSVRVGYRLEGVALRVVAYWRSASAGRRRPGRG